MDTTLAKNMRAVTLVTMTIVTLVLSFHIWNIYSSGALSNEGGQADQALSSLVTLILGTVTSILSGFKASYSRKPAKARRSMQLFGALTLVNAACVAGVLILILGSGS